MLPLPILVSPRIPATILQALRQDGHFTETLRLISAARVNDRLDSSESWTLIAVSDEAYRKLPATVRTTLLRPDLAKAMIENHLVKGKYGSISFMNGISPVGQPLRHRIKNQIGVTLVTQSDSRGLSIGNAKFVREVFSRNGSVLVVDRLIPVRRSTD